MTRNKADLLTNLGDRDLNDEELMIRLAVLKNHASQQPPLLDDDDCEAAIDEAAARIS